MVSLANIQDPAFLEDPYPFYEIGRQMSPLFLEGPDLWMVFKHEECAAILRGHANWSSRGAMPAEGGEEAPVDSMLGSDPPRHTRLRALVSQAFTPRMVEQLEPRLRQIAVDLLEPAIERGECDLVETLTYPLPVIAIAEILGVEPAKRERFKVWSDLAVAQLGINEGPLPEEIVNEMLEYFEPLFEQRRKEPRDDLVSGLVRAELEGEKLSLEELMQMLLLLLVAGNETTTNLIGNAMLEFIAHPEELAKVEASPSLLPGALEEVLRFHSPVQATVRRAVRDVDFAGKTIKRGQQVVVWLAAANRDPAQFPEPLRFDVTRTPNRHLAFGMGIHFCLGAPLARLEARVAWEELLRRGKSFRRTDDRVLPRVPTFVMRGVRELPVAFERR